MGKKSLEMAGPNVDKNIGMLQRAYAFEKQTSHYFQYIANNIERIWEFCLKSFLESVQERSKDMHLSLMIG
jgi:ferritin-like protein